MSGVWVGSKWVRVAHAQSWFEKAVVTRVAVDERSGEEEVWFAGLAEDGRTSGSGQKPLTDFLAVFQLDPAEAIGYGFRRVSPLGRGLVFVPTEASLRYPNYVEGTLYDRNGVIERSLLPWSAIPRSYERFELRTSAVIEAGQVWVSQGGSKVRVTDASRVRYERLETDGYGLCHPDRFLKEFDLAAEVPGAPEAVPATTSPSGVVHVAMKDGQVWVLEHPMTAAQFDDMQEGFDSMFSSWVTFETTGPRVSVRVGDIERAELHW